MGSLVAMEGNECSGKSTVIQYLKKYMERRGQTVTIHREPGGTDAGEDIRAIILDKEYPETISGLTEAYLYAASRSELVEKLVLPDLKKYDYVLLDRYYYSSLVWQGVVRGLGLPFVESINSPFMEKAKPDIAFYLDIPEEERAARMSQRTGKQDRLDKEPAELLRKVDEAYRAVSQQYPEFRVVDATGTPEVVAMKCLALIDYQKLKGGNLK